VAVALAGSVLAVGPPRAAAASAADVAGQPVPFGKASFYGSPGSHVAAPIVGMAAAPNGQGYWLVASDGGIFNYGSAGFHGSAGAEHLVQPIVAMAATPDGGGYWLVAADGGIFTYGDAHFYGSTGNIHLNAPIVGMAPTSTGRGYWLVASDGGIFTFGDARFHGSAGAMHLTEPVVGMAATNDGGGYWLAAADGGIFNYGDAPFEGSMGGHPLDNPVSSIAADRAAPGYWLLPTVPSHVNAPPGPTTALQQGDRGAAVVALQNRLNALGYWVGPADGSYGDATVQAVYALQKAAGLPVDGQAGPQTEAALNGGVEPKPQSAPGYVVEVDLARDLVMFVNDGRLEYTLNTSTGGGYTYTQDGQTDVAITPQGHFAIYRAVNGTVTDSLGTLYRPRYFTGGYAIHGDSYVPPHPVSHGCVRVSNEAIDWIWANNLLPMGTPVWVY
jgi:lipoprotein-anchoring transpeptidase ErfK/SrfK